MRLSELLERPVVDQHGQHWGTIHDARLVRDGPLVASGLAGFRLHGLLVGRGALGSRLGYAGEDEHRRTRGPLPIRALFVWLHRRAVYVPWTAVRELEGDAVLVEAPPGGFTRASSAGDAKMTP